MSEVLSACTSELVWKSGLSVLGRKLAGAFRPRISPWLRAPGCTRDESGRLAPRRPKLGQDK